jgi:hypothetical protein
MSKQQTQKELKMKKLLLTMTISACSFTVTADEGYKMFKNPNHIACLEEKHLQMAMQFGGAHEIAGVKSLIDMQLCFPLPVNERVAYKELERGEVISKIMIALSGPERVVEVPAYALTDAIR